MDTGDQDISFDILHGWKVESLRGLSKDGNKELAALCYAAIQMKL